ncbi:hypothetical protein [Lentzea sp. NBRC 102530]|uniref:hypothetical protein n=1 Tax=Lentzea sp. NBRC 102530 TaxID=3032201 RepID=UPI0024A490C4|nr:hypothetical protein [Lentzea sp. NBRC 102530]GLY53161.1 hypothetical protein Lesp01_68170 [Lentzea sp. NBRC 102530]
MTENTSCDSAEDYGQDTPAKPSERLRALDRLVGTWTVSGGATGTVRYESALGGFFLIQHVDLEQHGQTVTGFEVIGHLHPFGEPVSEEIASRFYDSQGNTFDYVYELEGDTLTIWADAAGSPAYFRGTFTDGGTVMAGEWVYPGGGGYPSVMTRQ